MVLLYLKKILNGIWVSLLKIQVAIFITAFAVMLTCLFIEVIFRYILQWKVIGFEELASAIAVWLYFAAAAYGTYEGSHLKADLAGIMFKTPRSQATVKAVASLISLGVASYMLTWSYDYFIWGLTMGEYIRIGGTIGSFPAIYSQASIFFGFNLMVLYFLVEFVKNIKKVGITANSASQQTV